MIPTLAFNRKASVWQWSRVQRLTLCILAAAAAVTAYAFRLWSLDKGIIPHDGGWLLYIFNTKADDLIIRGQLLFRYFPALSDIFWNRFTCWVINIICWSAFSLGFAYWLRKACNLKVRLPELFITLLGLSCITSMTADSTAGTPSLNYNQLIHCFSALSLGFLFGGLSVHRLWLYALSGMAMALVGTFQVTSWCLIPVMALTIWFASNGTHIKKIMFLMWWTLGFLLSIILFILIFDSWESLTDWWHLGMSVINQKDSSHSGDGLAKLFVSTIRYFVKIGLTAFIIIWLPRTARLLPVISRNVWLRRIFVVFSAIGITIYSLNNIPPVIDPILYLYKLKAVAWIAVLIVVVLGCRYVPKKEVMGIILLLLSPLCVSMGTNVPFLMIGSVRYIGPLLVMVLFIPRYGSRLVGWIPAAIFIYAFWLFIFPRDGKYKNWHPQVLTEQVIPLSELGFNQSVKVDEPSARMFEFYRDNVPTGAEALMHRSKWSTAVLLDLKAIDNNFNVATPWHEVTGIKAREVLDHGRTLYVLSVDSTNLRWQPEEYAPIDSLVRLLGDEGYEVLLKRAPSGDILYTINK